MSNKQEKKWHKPSLNILQRESESSVLANCKQNGLTLGPIGKCITVKWSTACAGETLQFPSCPSGTTQEPGYPFGPYNCGVCSPGTSQCEYNYCNCNGVWKS